MGVYSDVEVHPSLLPEEHRHLKYWQTKDVIDPMMSTLVITEDGQLIHKFTGIIKKFLGGKESEEELLYTGAMVFYTVLPPFMPGSKLLILTAEFVDGKLVSIKEDE